MFLLPSFMLKSKKNCAIVESQKRIINANFIIFYIIMFFIRNTFSFVVRIDGKSFFKSEIWEISTKATRSNFQIKALRILPSAFYPDGRTKKKLQQKKKWSEKWTRHRTPKNVKKTSKLDLGVRWSKIRWKVSRLVEYSLIIQRIINV